MNELEKAVADILPRANNSPKRLDPLADVIVSEIQKQGLQDIIGGTSGELKIEGLARDKNWDVAYVFEKKARLVISLKSVQSENPGAKIPNRIDEIIGETANVQQKTPEIVTGYVVMFDISKDKEHTKSNEMWSDFFEKAIKKISIRKAPLWNQGLLEATWFLRIDSTKPFGERIVNYQNTKLELEVFVTSLLKELTLREPAIPFTEELPD